MSEEKLNWEDAGVEFCPECSQFEVVAHDSSELERKDYDSEDDYIDAYNDMSDYSCLNCDFLWDCDELDDIQKNWRNRK